jgi:hypothetical protein
MPNWKKLIVSGSDAALNSLLVTTSVTASSVFISGSGSPLLSLPDAPQDAAIISGSSGTTSVYIYDSVDGIRTPTYDKGAGLRLVSGEGTGQATLDVSAVGSDNGGSANEQAFIRSNQMLSLYGEGNAAGDNIRFRGSFGYVALDSTTAGTSLTFVTNGGSTPSTIALGSFGGSAGVQITAPANNTYLRFIQGSDTWLDLTSTKATFLADVSSSATSTASFGHYIGDGSEITGVISSSYAITSSLPLEGLINASTSGNQITFDKGDGTSFMLTLNTGSVEFATSASYSETASYVDLVAGPNITINQVGTSFEISGSMADVFPYTGSAIISGSLNVIGEFTASGIIYPTQDGDNGDTLFTDGLGNLSFGKTTVYANVKNITAGTLFKGTPVHVTGSAGNANEVVAASASVADTMPAHFVLNEDITAGTEGLAIAIGFINGVDTSLFAEGDTVFVGESGGYTNVKPTGSNLIQNLGIVAKVDASNGSGYVLGAGRSNDVPNIPEGYTWIGNASQVATPTPTSSIQNVVSASYASTASYVNPLTQNVIITGSLRVLDGHIYLDANSYFLQGTSTGGSNLELIGVTAQDTIRIGNQGYDNIIVDDVTISGSLIVSSSLIVQDSTTLGGSLTTKTYRLTTASYTASATDYRIAVKYTNTGSVAIQLPLISEVGELEYKFKDEEGNAQLNRIMITASGSDLIDGDSTAIMNRNYMAIGLYNDGVSNWYIE